MRNNGLGIVVGFFLAGVVVIGILFESLPIIGIGTAVSLFIGTEKYFSEISERKKRETNENIKQLKPKIYAPLLKWADSVQKELKEYDVEDIYSHSSDFFFRDLDAEVDYIVIVGETLKKRVEKIKNIFQTYLEISEQIRKEYHNRAKIIITKFGKGWTYDNTQLINENSTLNLTSFFYSYRFITIKKHLKSSKPLLLKHNQNPVQTKECPKELIEALQQTNNLSSFNQYKMVKEHLEKELDLFISKLKIVIINGENDWKFN